MKSRTQERWAVINVLDVDSHDWRETRDREGRTYADADENVEPVLPFLGPPEALAPTPLLPGFTL